jgi:hypothetical protein
MIDALRPYLARALAILVAWLVAHFGLAMAIDNAEQQKLVSNIVDLVIEILGIYAATHRLSSKIFNPGDAASSHLAAAEKVETLDLKRFTR